MLSRTSESIVTFHHPFSIGNAISDYPAGSFRVVKEEELIQGVLAALQNRKPEIAENLLKLPITASLAAPIRA
ncbi:MAG: hypothetical protein EOO82_03600, partial [Oxalobacteraceae bacterium]